MHDPSPSKLARAAFAAVAVICAAASAAGAAPILSPVAAPFVDGSATELGGLVLPGIGPATQYAQNVRVVSDSFNLVSGVETISITYDDFVQFTQNGVTYSATYPSTATYTLTGRTASNQTGTFAETLVAATTSGTSPLGNTVSSRLDPARSAGNTGTVSITPTAGGYLVENDFAFNSELSVNGGAFVALPTQTGSSLPIGFTAPTTPAPVPEPASLALLGVPLVGMHLLRRRRGV